METVDTVATEAASEKLAVAHSLSVVVAEHPGREEDVARHVRPDGRGEC